MQARQEGCNCSRIMCQRTYHKCFSGICNECCITFYKTFQQIFQFETCSIYPRRFYICRQHRKRQVQNKYSCLGFLQQRLWYFFPDWPSQSQQKQGACKTHNPGQQTCFLCSRRSRQKLKQVRFNNFLPVSCTPPFTKQTEHQPPDKWYCQKPQRAQKMKFGQQNYFK